MYLMQAIGIPKTIENIPSVCKRNLYIINTPHQQRGGWVHDKRGITKYYSTRHEM